MRAVLMIAPDPDVLSVAVGEHSVARRPDGKFEVPFGAVEALEARGFTFADEAPAAPLKPSTGSAPSPVGGLVDGPTGGGLGRPTGGGSGGATTDPALEVVTTNAADPSPIAETSLNAPDVKVELVAKDPVVLFDGAPLELPEGHSEALYVEAREAGLTHEDALVFSALQKDS